MIVFHIFGGLFLVIGAIGLFLPVWPTTIFWILAAVCFARSSPEARDWIYGRPGIGPQIEDFVERGTISNAGKVAAVTGISIAAVICTFVLWSRTAWLVGTLGVLVCVVVFIVTRRKD